MSMYLINADKFQGSRSITPPAHRIVLNPADQISEAANMSYLVKPQLGRRIRIMTGGGY
jgi:hypothetical protein